MNDRWVVLVFDLLVGIGVGLVLAYFWFRARFVGLQAEHRRSLERIQALEADEDRKLAEARLAMKEEALRLRERLEEELKDRQREIDRQAARLADREEAAQERALRLDEREKDLRAREAQLDERARRLSNAEAEVGRQLSEIARLTPEEARQIYLSRLESELHELGVRRAQEIEAATEAEAERRAKKLLLEIMERNAVEYVTEATIAVVTLPSEDMKGRIIGREGRNIRAFEQVTGTDLIVDDTPEAVVISCFDPVRRETARLALMNLMVDGRIHPGRIEELYEQAQAEVRRLIGEAGERAAERASVPGLHPAVIETMGRLRFRTSHAQNVLDHSVEVAHLSAMLASELGFREDIARRAGFLHDIGKALGSDWEGPHALAGMEFLRQYGLGEQVLHAVGAHHHDIPPQSPEAKIVIVADAISAARPGARRENLDNFIKRLTALEEIANGFPGIERCYALQGGREIRVIVRPQEVDDLQASRLALQLAHKIETELEYPGQIKVTVIRETRATSIAR